jgi:transitional endoplasmic reticulum ATPase
VQVLEILERLADNPFDDALRSQLASHYADSGEWEKAHKQLTLVKKQRPLATAELSLLATSLRELGFDDEADLILSSNKTEEETDEAPPPHEEKPSISIVPSAEKPVVVPINAAKKDRIRLADIAGLEEVKKTIRMQIIEPFTNPEIFARFGKKAGGGVLLYGPPGCGKTMIARAIADECHAEFLAIGISDILGIYHGESEQNLSTMFEKARANKPCVMFFDELDALAFARAKTSSVHGRTLVNEFLNQLDGVGHDNDDILFLSASNMPWDVDAAMKRPGRFSRQIFVPPPDLEAKIGILQRKLQHLPRDDFDIPALAGKLKRFSGADIDGLIEQAKEIVLQHILETGVERNLTLNDIQLALSGIVPSTEEWLQTAKNLVKYSGADRTYQAVQIYLKKNGML